MLWKKKLFGDFVMALAFSPAGRYFAAGGEDPFVAVFDTRTRRRIARLPQPRYVPSDDRLLAGKRGGVWSLAFAPDERAIAVGGADDAVRLFALPSGEAIRALQGVPRPLDLAWSPDGTMLAVTSGTGIQLWNVADGTRVRELVDDTEVRAVAFSPDGKTLAGGGGLARTIRLWDVATGAER